MKGFKSFGKKTEIPFSDGFNCILGPNGSGKSNILDSICFVLGKMGSKSLRAEKTANLIYNGGKKGSAAKQGTVSIYFSNDEKELNDEDEVVKITRVIKKSGQSDYLINDEMSTRTNIIEMLSKAKINPDGYNIILQGDINHLIEMSGVERRQIIEEIAGINIYEEKKRKAERELDRVEEKINEADIILTERKSHLEELKEDKDKAQEFKDLDNKLKRNTATLLSIEIKELEEEKEKKQGKKETLVEKIKKKETKNAELRETIASKKNEIKKLSEEVEERGEEKQVQVQKKVENLKVKIAENKKDINNYTQELENITSRRENLREEVKELESKLNIHKQERDKIQKEIDTKQDEITRIEEKIAEFKEERNLDDASQLDKQIDELEKEIDEKQEEVTKLRSKQQEKLREKDKAETRLETVDEKIQKLLEVEEENKDKLEKLKDYKRDFKRATVSLSKALNKDSDLASQQSNAHSKLLQKKESYSRLKAKSAGIKDRMAGGNAINDVLQSNINGVLGVISELGDVKKEHALALEVSAGGRIKSIVTDTDQSAAKCIQLLKSKRSGTASFIPLNKIKARPINPNLRRLNQSGVVGLAIDLVNFDPKFEKAFRYVFGNTLIVKDVKTARKLGVGKYQMVTLEGDKINTSGAMQGGHRRRRRGLGFMEKEVKEKMSSLEAEIQNLETLNEKLKANRHENNELIDTLREQKAELEGEIIKLEKTLRVDSDDLDEDKEKKDELQSTINELEQEVDDVTMKVSQTNRELSELKMKKQELRNKINDMRNPEILAELTSYEQKRSELKDEITELRLEKTKIEQEEKNVFGRDKEKTYEILKNLDSDQEKFNDKKEELLEETKELEQDLESKEKDLKEFYDEFKEVFNKRNKLSDEVSSLESKIMENNGDIKNLENKKNALNIDLARIKAELSGRMEEYSRYEGVPLFEDKDVKEMKKEVKTFKNMKDDFGNVNMKALEIYDEVQKQYEKLMEKKERLVQEKEDVILMIHEVDTKKQELFKKTFEVVNHNFQEIFQTLNKKGQATLDLENEEQPLEGGMGIKVKITGNKYLDIRALSGGEKTMTALAFLFAVQEHEPAAFYILDEVDAALDKKNSERLAKLVREYSDRAQYIMISHNDEVINLADKLYGISLTSNGISKVTTLEV